MAIRTYGHPEHMTARTHGHPCFPAGSFWKEFPGITFPGSKISKIWSLLVSRLSKSRKGVRGLTPGGYQNEEKFLVAWPRSQLQTSGFTHTHIRTMGGDAMNRGSTHTCTLYRYGMRLRGFSPGCQPMRGFYERQDDPTGRYHDVLLYERQLSNKEVSEYELDFLGTVEK